MTFPSNPALNDPHTEAGIDYVFDGIRWVPASAEGGGLTPQERRIFNGMLGWAQENGKLRPPLLNAWAPRTGIFRGAPVNYLVSSTGGLSDNFTITIDWKDGSPVQVINARVDGVWDPALDPEQWQLGFLEIPHTLPVDFALGAWAPSVLLTNEWGDTGPTNGAFVVVDELGAYTFSYNSLLAGLTAPTQASMSDNDATNSVFATKPFSAGEGTPFLMIDFGVPSVPDWMTLQRAKVIPGTAYTSNSPEYWMRQRTLEYGVDDGQGGITWTVDDNFEPTTSWAGYQVDKYSIRISRLVRYLRFSMASNFTVENTPDFGVAFGDISFGHVDRTNEPST